MRHAELEGALAIPVGIGEHLDAEAVPEGEQDRGHGLGVGLQAYDAVALLLTQPAREALAPLPVELGELRADLLRVARGREHLVDHGLAAGVVLEELVQPNHESVNDLVDRVGAREPLVHRLVADLAVVAHHLDEQALLRAEVVVQEAARDAGLTRHVVEGRCGGPASPHARAHGSDDALSLVALEPAR